MWTGTARSFPAVSERYYPAKGQKFFLKGGVIDNPKYEYRGPETLEFRRTDAAEGIGFRFMRISAGCRTMERRVIWGMMVGEEGKTKIPVLQNYTERGFDPAKLHMPTELRQRAGSRRRFLPQERQLFGAPGGVMHDWDLQTNIEGIYAAGDQLYRLRLLRLCGSDGILRRAESGGVCAESASSRNPQRKCGTGKETSLCAAAAEGRHGLA